MKLLTRERKIRNAVYAFTLFTSQLISAQSAIQWQHSFGGSSVDGPRSVRQLLNGDYIVAGSSASNDGDVTGHHDSLDIWIVYLNSNGNMQWQKSLGGTGNEDAYVIRMTSDGGYILAGNSSSNDGDVTGNHGVVDAWVIKLDPVGAIVWQKSFGGSGYDAAFDIQQTSEGGYVFAGTTWSNDGDVTGNHGGQDVWVVKLDSTGILQWQQTFGGTNVEDGFSIQQTSDGGYCVAGRSASVNGDLTLNHGLQDFWFFKLDNTGSLQWQKSFGGSDDDFGLSAQQTSDGGYILAGSARSNNGDVTGNHGLDDMWIVKLDASGIMQWQKSLGGTLFEKAFSILQISNGGYIVAGMASSHDNDVTGHHGGFMDAWLLQLSNSGNLQWQKTLGGSGEDEAFSVTQTADGGFVVAAISNSGDGDLTGNNGGFDFWIVKLDSTVGIEDVASLQPVSVFPNPAGDRLMLHPVASGHAEIEIQDARGVKLISRSQEVSSGEEVLLDVSALASGMYFLRLQIGRKIWMSKFSRQN